MGMIITPFKEVTGNSQTLVPQASDITVAATTDTTLAVLNVLSDIMRAQKMLFPAW